MQEQESIVASTASHDSGGSDLSSSCDQESRNGEASAGLGITDGETRYPNGSLQTTLFQCGNTMPIRRQSLSISELAHPADEADEPDPKSLKFLQKACPSAFEVAQPYFLTPVPLSNYPYDEEIRNPDCALPGTTAVDSDVHRTSSVKGPLSDAHMGYLRPSRSYIGPRLSLETKYIAPEPKESDVGGGAVDNASHQVDQVVEQSEASPCRDSDGTITVEGSDPHGYKNAHYLSSTPEHIHLYIASSPPLPASWASSPEPTINDTFLGGHELPETVQDDPKGQSPVVDGRPPSPDAWALRYKRRRSPDSPCPQGRIRPAKVWRRGRGTGAS